MLVSSERTSVLASSKRALISTARGSPSIVSMPMSKQTLTLAVALPLIAGLLALGRPARADADPLAFSTCATDIVFGCATLGVPLDRSGQILGVVALSVKRKLAGVAQTSDAVLALAGGPGQAALPLADFMAQAMAPALGTRDLLVYDQRGTGQSGALGCDALTGSGVGSIADVFSQCAVQIGAARGLYTTQDSVQDIDALRQAAGYDRLVLFGVSYGTKVALEYAARYPQHVEALVLDSVEPTDGPSPFELPTFQAMRPVLSELCSKRVCAHVTPTPLADVAQLVKQLNKRVLTGSVYDGSGRRYRASFDPVDLFDILQGGDLNPALRALLPAAVRSALRHDPDPLLRLNLLSEGLIPNVHGSLAAARASAAAHRRTPAGDASSPDGLDGTLNIATLCEEMQFPWQRDASVAQRKTQALTALFALPTSAFYPFDRTTALAGGPTPGCVEWPVASPPPPPAAALPVVPTLILSGAQDLRTPTSDARRVAALIPGAQVLVVPFTGHSVIGSDFSGCAQLGVAAFFQGAAVQPCKPTAEIFTPTSVAPRKLDYVPAAHTVAGRPGRTLTAVLASMRDLQRQVIGATLEANQQLPSGSGIGGLRGGYARIVSSGVRLTRFSYIPGVQLSGALFISRSGKLQSAAVQVGGASAAHGEVHISLSDRVSGTLGGVRFNIKRTTVKLSSVGAAAGNWPSARQVLGVPSGVRIP
ncbi:MAG TPA: alpha/beta fold hydrolase [Solirubrobacteraceae bacterium]|nr:alpha/beta fold hydrolase [Solirubrobacteraceae bacterium]